MIPPVRTMSPSPAAPAAPAAPPAAPMAPPAGAGAAVTPQLLAFRKALGVPPNQAAPEAKVIAAMSGQLGANVKQMAMSIASPAPGAPPAGSDPVPDAAGAAAPTPPSGPTGASMFSGRDSTPVSDAPDDDEDEEPTGAGMFGGRK